MMALGMVLLVAFCQKVFLKIEKIVSIVAFFFLG